MYIKTFWWSLKKVFWISVRISFWFLSFPICPQVANSWELLSYYETVSIPGRKLTSTLLWRKQTTAQPKGDVGTAANKRRNNFIRKTIKVEKKAFTHTRPNPGSRVKPGHTNTAGRNYKVLLEYCYISPNFKALVQIPPFWKKATKWKHQSKNKTPFTQPDQKCA